MAMADRKADRLLEWYALATAEMVRGDDPDLTTRQMSVLLKSYLDDTDQTVRGLAAYLKVSKPAITRALDRLAEFDLVRRRTDAMDRRSIIVVRTTAGHKYLRKFGEVLVSSYEHRGGLGSD